MSCKHLGWLINQGIYWCNKDNKRDPFKCCKNCPDYEENDWGVTYTNENKGVVINAEGKIIK